jgi:hypothetical protein
MKDKDAMCERRAIRHTSWSVQTFIETMRCGGDAATAESEAVASNATLAMRATIDIDESRAARAVEAPRIALGSAASTDIPPVLRDWRLSGECGGFS